MLNSVELLLHNEVVFDLVQCAICELESFVLAGEQTSLLLLFFKT